MAGERGWFEHRNDPPLPRRAFFARLARHGGYAALLALFSLLVGMSGYHWIGGQSWVDSFLNSSMLLGGMGPVGELSSSGAKIFAGLFALYSGIVFLFVAAIMMAPIFHRVLHKFHWEYGAKRD
jgi:hypothetical protein